MNYAVVSSKGQIVIPSSQRRRLGLSAGAKVEFIDEPDGLRLRVVRSLHASDVSSLAGLITARSTGMPRSLDDFDAASVANQSP